jgi:Transglycosylase SLT domain/Peptidase family M23
MREPRHPVGHRSSVRRAGHVRLFAVVVVITAAVAATVATTPASAETYLVTVRLDDGTLTTVVVDDLPPGATLADLTGNPGVPGTPVSLEQIPEEPQNTPPPEPAPDEPPDAAPPMDSGSPPDAGSPPDGASPPDTPPPPADSPGASPPDAAPPVADPAPAEPGANQTQEEPRDTTSGEEASGPRPRPQRLADEGASAEPPSKTITAQRRPGNEQRLRHADGSPTRGNPGFVEAMPGPFAVLTGPSIATGVPNFIIRKFRVPPFLLSIYQAAGVEYGLRWEVLAAINEIESDYGRNLNVSSAGAVGWMQFLPSSWRRFGVDANKDGRKDPYNPVDAIFAAARYLDAAGYSDDPRRAIFAYNHADWYVDSVLLRARLIAAVPSDLIGSLTGLTEGRFPVRGRATYADDIAERELLKRVGRGENAANLIQSSEQRRSIDIFAKRDARVVAVNDGVIKRLARRKDGRRLVMQDVYGNRYTYAHLGRVSRHIKVGKRVRGGAVVGRIGRTVTGSAPHLRFSIRPSGRGAPRIDPKPILDGWQLLEATEIYRANGANVLRDGPTIGQILLLSKPLLQKRVLADDRIELYRCGRADIAAGRVDRRVLATLAFLSESGFSPTVSSLRCGHSYLTKSGNISEHSTGNAVDISKINGVPVLGHQEPGGVADQAVRRLLLLQGTMVPHQVISLLAIGGPTMAMSDHADHIHVGFRPAGEAWSRAGYSVLKPSQWPALMSRLNVLENPVVP